MSVVDLSFPVRGTTVPIDHGYMLLGALSDHVPGLHGGAEAIGVLPIFGKRHDKSDLRVVEGKSRVTLRLRDDLAPATARGLAGRSIEVGAVVLHLGDPEVRPLEASAGLRSRFVTIKGYHVSDEAFLGALQRHVALTVDGEPMPAATLQRRRIMQIHQHRVVGYGVVLRGLTDRASLLVQAVGLGGRRGCGAGIFLPLNPAGADDPVARRKAILGVA